MNDPRPIRRWAGGDHRIALPPSKSYTNRALIAAALAAGASAIAHPSASDDSAHLIGALRAFGVEIESNAERALVRGSGGTFDAPPREIFVGNAGTAFRFLTAMAAIGRGTSTITGDAQMLRRPQGELVAALRAAGVAATSTGGLPPVTVAGGTFRGGRVALPGATSSQFLSALLLSAPYAAEPMEILSTGPQSSAPYVSMTLEVMRAFGARVEAPGGGRYLVGNDARYAGQEYAVEADASAAGYFLAAAAVTGGSVTLPGLARRSLQPDVGLLDLLSAMGCSVSEPEGGVALRGGALRGIEADCNAMPDSVPALAVAALFAEGPTTIRNVAHLRFKETDRLVALARELAKLGARVALLDDGLEITPGALHGERIETYNDHRIAMSFAVAGLRIPGTTIANPGCVTKSFPGFWEAFTALEG